MIILKIIKNISFDYFPIKIYNCTKIKKESEELHDRK